jgi:hypothetical protein
MAPYFSNRLIPVGVEAQLLSDNGGFPDFSRLIGSEGWGIGVQIRLPVGTVGGDYAQVWAQPCIPLSQPFGPPGTEDYMPIGGTGQLIIPGPIYCWSRRELGLDALALNATPAAQIDLGIALWRRRKGGVLSARVFRLL